MGEIGKIEISEKWESRETGEREIRENIGNREIRGNREKK